MCTLCGDKGQIRVFKPLELVTLTNPDRPISELEYKDYCLKCWERVEATGEEK